MQLRSPLGAFGSVLGFVAIVAAIAATAWVDQSRAAAWSAPVYPLLLTVAYWVVKKKRAAQIG
jgi:L-asparagine transporter-like permease